MTIRRRSLLTLPALLAGAAATADESVKVLRYAFRVAETGFDPPRLSDLYSRILTGHIYEALYTYDPLARPAKIVPLIAEAMPEISEDFRTWTVRLKQGICFADDPAFKGQRREVTAHDFVYSIQRYADPALQAQAWVQYEDAGFIGLAAQRQKAIKGKKPFDYAAPIEGVRALDRYTLQFRTEQPRPRLMELVLAGSDLYGAVAREVVEFYGDKLGEHPVGTGPFRLKSWRRSSQIVFERNPAYRERYYEAQPAADDAEGQALLARFKGRRLPMVDQVEVVIIEENQPRWLAFLSGEQNFVERVPEDFISQAMPHGKLAPNLAKRGMQAFRTLAPDVMLTLFNMNDPVVGGIEPAKVALRRAIGLGLDVPRELQQVRRGQAIVAQSMVQPHTSGYDPAYKSEMGDYDPDRARALLDLYGYVDRDGDGWREQPDGSPLMLERRTQADGLSRQVDEVWDSSMRALGLRLKLTVKQWPENLKAAQAAQYMIWDVAFSAAQPDAIGALQLLYGPAAGTFNFPRFVDPRYDRLYQQMQSLPDGPERAALFREAKRIQAAWEPLKSRGHRIITDMAAREVIGFRRPLFWQDWWQYIDISSSS
ncbi:ABC transporter substrate-binding protein [Pelomonas sp. KK5]|uniref:ABC transporter substrate-binding protein n=1 Tax=Pelomonas sp. KK5 TaxID=1855730 RepID=UPI00097C930C|nr:ABC transporter substrate-binding protein [Pelomonas sp. KK5]